MADNKIGGLPVVDEDNHVVGVITETDVFRAFIDIYRAGHSGLYLTLEVPDRKGMVVELSRAIFDLGGQYREREFVLRRSKGRAQAHHQRP